MLSTIITLLAHDLRWQIIQLLLHSDYRVNELVDALEQPMNLVSYHLRQLREARLVQIRRNHVDRRDVFYSIDIAYFQQELHNAMQLLHPALQLQLVSSDNFHLTTTRRLSILILSSDNRVRSQFAEALMRHYCQAQFDVLSAGIHYDENPEDTIPVAVSKFAQENLSLDMSQQSVKSYATLPTQTYDYVITLSDEAHDFALKSIHTTQILHWALPMPGQSDHHRLSISRLHHLSASLRLRILYFLQAQNNTS